MPPQNMRFPVFFKFLAKKLHVASCSLAESTPPAKHPNVHNKNLRPILSFDYLLAKSDDLVLWFMVSTPWSSRCNIRNMELLFCLFS